MQRSNAAFSNMQPASERQARARRPPSITSAGGRTSRRTAPSGANCRAIRYNPRSPSRRRTAVGRAGEMDRALRRRRVASLCASRRPASVNTCRASGRRLTSWKSSPTSRAGIESPSRDRAAYRRMFASTTGLRPSLRGRDWWRSSSLSCSAGMSASRSDCSSAIATSGATSAAAHVTVLILRRNPTEGDPERQA